MTNRDEVMSFLTRISPKSASNSDIASHTGIRPHAQVFQITRHLMNEGRIKGRRAGHEWHFFVGDGSEVSPKLRPAKRQKKSTSTQTGTMTPAAFERFCQTVMSKKYGVALTTNTIGEVRKQFDLVSDDGSVVGDAKYYTAVNGTSLPPAKFATIAEYVWLLEKTEAKNQFLVFGNDKRVPEWWLERYGNLIENTKFYFLSDDGDLELLN